MKNFHTDYSSDKDLLGFVDYETALHEIVVNAPTPLTIGVFGPWGSGKTTLLRMLRKRIEAEAVPGRRTVWFTAWKYTLQDSVWRALILRVLNALYPREPEPADLPREARPLLAVERQGKLEQERVALLKRLEESVYGPVSWTEPAERALDIGPFIGRSSQAGLKLAAWLATAGFYPRLVELLGDKGSVSQDVQAAAAAISIKIKEQYRSQLFYREQFEATFAEAIAQLDGRPGQPHASESSRLVVFVDDLDRCLPEQAVAILEAIKLFLEAPGVVFVLGMDPGVIAKGIEAHYGALFHQQGVQDDLPISGQAYLQKIIQLPFHLPHLSVTDIESYIDALTRDGDLPTLVRSILARGMLPNPRQAKRVLNMLGLLQAITERRVGQNTISLPLLAKSVIIQVQYPHLYQLWRQYPTLVQVLEQAYRHYSDTDYDSLRSAPNSAGGTNSTKQSATDLPRMPVLPSERYQGLLQDYLNFPERYPYLVRMMTFPAPEDARGAAAYFENLDRPALLSYVRLAGGTELVHEATEAHSTVTIEALLSGDLLKINEAATVLGSGSEANLNLARQHMLAVIEDRTRPVQERMSAGEALTKLGDPRFFGIEGLFLPRDELAGLVALPAGTFVMGSRVDDPDGRDNERPADCLQLNAFYLGKFPVTVDQYRCFIDQSGYTPGNPACLQGPTNHPVRFLAWKDASAYCDWLNHHLLTATDGPEQLTDLLTDGWRLTLPSEAEWEYAARAGLGQRYPWGESYEKDRANHERSRLGVTCAVGVFAGHGWQGQFADLGGNVWEWTRSDYRPYPYKSTNEYKQMNPAGREMSFVLRGGAFASEPYRLRCAYRYHGPLFDGRYSGMRLCLTRRHGDS